MLNIRTFQVNMIGENCYIVSDETKEAVVVDCGAYSPAEEQRIAAYIEAEGLQVKHLLCTHGHFDHVFGNAFITRRYGVCPTLHQADEPLYKNMASQVRDFLGTSYTTTLPPVGHYVADGDEIRFGTHVLTVIHTPGHSPGGVEYYCREEAILFSGDSLFRCSIGRTDLPGGSHRTLTESLTDRILTLPDDVKVYPGHGPATTVGTEKQMNPYLV